MVPEGPPVVAVVASVVSEDAGWLSAGALGAGPLPAGAEWLTSGGAGAFVTVGTDAGGVTWIWPSDCWDTGTGVEVATGVVVMLAHGVVPTWTWPLSCRQRVI